jgi:alkanesulfonate monooxygenase SsuD/methylene tetrahydromethanopterin reductase-like flavin-dependent oxidoreductase (luciferase family)
VTTRPFAVGSVSLGLHPATELDAGAQVTRLIAEARLAERAGFDGVTLSEHHGGFPSYLPQPLLAAGWILDATEHVWAAPAPVLLGLRSPVHVAEELCWTAARHPGRVAIGVASGYSAGEFELFGLDPSTRTERFRDAQQVLVAVLRGEHPASADAAISAWRAAPSTLLSATNSSAAVRVAAALGMGIIFPGGEDPDRLGRLSSTYRDAGGPGPVVWIRGFWIGDPPRTAAAAALTSTYREQAAAGTRQGQGFHSQLLSGPPDVILEQAADHVRRAGVDAVNARLHVAGAAPGAVAEQIVRFGAEVAPGLRHLVGLARRMTAP